MLDNNDQIVSAIQSLGLNLLKIQTRLEKLEEKKSQEKITDRTPEAAYDVLIKWGKYSNLTGYFVGFYGIPLGRNPQAAPGWHIKINDLDSVPICHDILVISWQKLPD